MPLSNHWSGVSKTSSLLLTSKRFECPTDAMITETWNHSQAIESRADFEVAHALNAYQ